jgi:hypothetical protein
LKALALVLFVRTRKISPAIAMAIRFLVEPDFLGIPKKAMGENR